MQLQWALIDQWNHIFWGLRKKLSQTQADVKLCGLVGTAVPSQNFVFLIKHLRKIYSDRLSLFWESHPAYYGLGRSPRTFNQP